MEKETREIEEFWREVENEHQSTLLIATPADYIGGCPADTVPVSGLLYILRNGIYFENFPGTAWFGSLFKINTPFSKIKLQFKKENIIGVSCFGRQTTRRSLIERLSLFFSTASRQFTVTYKNSGQEQDVTFRCVKNARDLCDAFNSIEQ